MGPDKTCKETVWLTPPHVIQCVQDYFGGQIPLDPATQPNNPTGAAKFYTELDNGLVHPWDVPFFVNPPYGKGLPLWCAKINSAVSRGVSCIALLPAGSGRPGTKYWQAHILNANLNALCYTKGRLAFLNAAGVPMKGNTYPSYLFGYNVDVARFVKCFWGLGKILKVSVEN